MKSGDLTMKAYQIQPPDVLITLQVRSEVQLIHEFENEGEWALPGGIYPGEWHENIVTVGEATACQRFLEQPLRVTSASKHIAVALNTHQVGGQAARRGIVSVQFDCDFSSVVPLPDPDVRETTCVDGTRPNDLQVSLS